MTLTDVATVVFLAAGIALLVTGEFARTRLLSVTRRVLMVLWIAGAVGFAIEAATVLGPIVRRIVA